MKPNEHTNATGEQPADLTIRDLRTIDKSIGWHRALKNRFYRFFCGVVIPALAVIFIAVTFARGASAVARSNHLREQLDSPTRAHYAERGLTSDEWRMERMQIDGAVQILFAIMFALVLGFSGYFIYWLWRYDRVVFQLGRHHLESLRAANRGGER